MDVLKKKLKDLEKRLILEALQKVDWNVLKAAGILGVPWTTLYRRMVKMGIPRIRVEVKKKAAVNRTCSKTIKR